MVGIGPGALSGDAAQSGTPAGGGRAKITFLVFCAEVVLAATGTVEKQVGVVMLVMDFGVTADETVLDPSCDFPDFRLDLENDGRATLLFELFAVLTTGTVTKLIGL